MGAKYAESGLDAFSAVWTLFRPLLLTHTNASTSIGQFLPYRQINMAKGSASQHALRKYQHDEGPYWALVTGATNGMGYEWASQLAALGFSILLHGRSEAKLEKTKAEILAKLEDNHSIEIRLVVADAGLTPPNLAGLNEALADEKMNLRVVVNNIGITNEDYPLLEDLGEEDVLKMVALNATFPTLVARKTLPLLKKQSNTPSLMVNVASLGAWAPSP